MPRVLFGPASPTFTIPDLGDSSNVVLFDFDGVHPLKLTADGSWEPLRARWPAGWEPDVLVLGLSYSAVPTWLYRAPVPVIGLAPDWNLLWSCYRHRVPHCDLVLTDPLGVEHFRRAGHDHVRGANLFGLEASFLTGLPPAPPERDIDVLFVGNCNPAVQRERLAWLGRLGRLADRWNVVIRDRVPRDEYRALLSRAKIVLNRSIRGECNMRVFEALAGGALLLQERENEAVMELLQPGREYVRYGADDLEAVIEHYLTHDDERRTLAATAHARRNEFTYAAFWQQTLAVLESEWEVIRARAVQRVAAPVRTNVAAAVWTAVTTGTIRELQHALADGPPSAAKSNAAGVCSPHPADAAGHFAQALSQEPRHAVAGFNCAEALARTGRYPEAIAQAQRTLALLEQPDGLADESLDAPHYPPGFDLLGVEWERAGWMNAGNLEGEKAAKRTLLRAWLHSLLGDLTGQLNHFVAAEQARPDLGSVKAALGCALARHQRLVEARPLLQEAVNGNPFDRAAARALHQVLNDSAAWPEKAAFTREQLVLHKAAPGLVPVEDWFREPPLSGRERTSIIVLACNEVAFTRLCLESVLLHTRGEYELILVDNGSTDETPQVFAEVANRSGPARVEVIRNDDNKGFAGGVNQGLAQARGEFLVLLNNDTVVTEGWLDGLIRWVLSDWPHVGMTGPMTNYTAAPQQVQPGYTELSGLDAFARQRREQFAGQALNAPRLTGFCLLVRRAVLETIGGRLDERYGLGFFEDDDLCHHARQAGFQLLAVPGVYIHHFGSRTFAGLGIETEQQLRTNFERFRAKWGERAAAPYLIPDPNRARGPVPDAARHGVSLCMIVKNEEYNLADCLGPVRDLVQEMVIVDTGSTDRTVQLAQSLGARVIEWAWRDSFSAARNVSIEHARGEWIFWMDADDRIDPDNRVKLQRLFAALDNRHQAHVLKCRCVAPAPGETATVVDHVRLFRNDPRLRWRYRVHEQILPAIREAQGNIQWSDVVVQHVGYTDRALRTRKLERDLRLLYLEYGEQPNDPFTLFNLGSVHLELNQIDQALPMLRRSLEVSHPHDSIVRKLYSMIAQCHRLQNQLDAAVAACVEGRKLYPNDPELQFVLGGLLTDKGDRRAAEEQYRQLIGGREEEHFASVADGLRGHKARHNLAVLYIAEGRWSEAEAQWRAALLDEPAFFPAHLGLGEALLQRKDWARLDEQARVMGQLGPRGEEEAVILQGRALLERQEFPRAREHFLRGLQRFPQSMNLRGLLSQLLNRPENTPTIESAPAALPAPDHVVSATPSEPSPVPRRVLVLCPDNDTPSGGVRRLYRHVDVLCAHGMPAWVVHEKPGFRCHWFRNTTPILDLSQARPTPSDFLVLPEIFVHNLAALAPGVPKVIFNQNAYFTFRGWPLEGTDGFAPYRHPDVVATLSVSDDNRDYLQYTFPGVPVHRVHYGIDPLFAPAPKRKVLAYMPRKNAQDVVQVLNLLRGRGALAGWDLVPIDGVPEAEVAKRLGECAVFLSFGHPEGCPLPPLEAMASGCVVVGYHGRGGREYFDPEFSYPVEVGDVVGFAKAVEEVLGLEQREPGTLERKGTLAAEHVRAKYSPEREAQDIVGIWEAIRKEQRTL